MSVFKHRRLSPSQNTKIYKLAGEIGMHPSELSEHVEDLFGVKHHLALSKDQAGEFIRFLETCRPSRPALWLVPDMSSEQKVWVEHQREHG